MSDLFTVYQVFGSVILVSVVFFSSVILIQYFKGEV